MFHINQKDCAYRFGDSGPKYLMRGPRAGMGLARLKPGEDFGNHYHEAMEENFYVLKGTIEFVVDGTPYIGSPGDLYHMEPGESHYLRNVGDEESIVVFFLTPFQEGDKVNTPLIR